MKNEEHYSYNRSGNARQIHSQSRIDIEFYLAELLLTAEINLSKKVLDLILNPVYAEEHKKSRYGRDDLFEFCSKIPKYSIYKLDEIISESNNEEDNKTLINNFWTIWKYFFEKIKESKKSYFISTLLLDIEWNKESSH